LHGVKLDRHKVFILGLLARVGLTDERLNDAGLGLLAEDPVGEHIVNDLLLTFFEGHFTSVDIEFGVFGLFKSGSNTCKERNFTSASLLVKTLDITAFANFKRSRDVSLTEFETSFLVEVLGHVASFLEWGNKSNKDNLASHVKQLGDFGDAADVLRAISIRETEALVKTSADHIAIKDENLLVSA
jgi:hypothetical protein